MPKTVFDPQARVDVQRRIGTLGPESPRQWGTLTIQQAVAHMGDQIRLGLGDIPAPPESGFMSLRPVAYLLIHVLPWPKGAKGPAAAFTTPVEELRADVDKLRLLVDRAAQLGEHGQWCVHPTFGNLNSRDWGVLTYRHLDHHLKQFSA